MPLTYRQVSTKYISIFKTKTALFFMLFFQTFSFCILILFFLRHFILRHPFALFPFPALLFSPAQVAFRWPVFCRLPSLPVRQTGRHRDGSRNQFWHFHKFLCFFFSLSKFIPSDHSLNPKKKRIVIFLASLLPFPACFNFFYLWTKNKKIIGSFAGQETFGCSVIIIAHSIRLFIIYSVSDPHILNFFFY